jgi:hypothetical protein
MFHLLPALAVVAVLKHQQRKRSTKFIILSVIIGDNNDSVGRQRTCEILAATSFSS